jgi:hypothetical protein
MRRSELVGRRFDRLLVIAYAGSLFQKSHWLCRCDCGVEKVVNGVSLKRGLSHSCGCWRVEVGERNGRKTKGSNGNKGATRKHGEAIARTAEYRTWVSMHERCRSPKSQKWANYGGRGIKVCERWALYETFLADMGRRPSKLHSLDRVENDGHYEPSNCRWATKKEQVDNRRKFGRIELFTDSELLRELTRRRAAAPVCITGVLGALA